MSQLLKILAVVLFALGLVLVVFVNGTDTDTLWAVLFGGLTLFTLAEIVP